MDDICVGDEVEIIEDSAMSIFGYMMGDKFIVFGVNKQGHLCIDPSKPNEYWKSWRFKKL